MRESYYFIGFGLHGSLACVYLFLETSPENGVAAFGSRFFFGPTIWLPIRIVHWT